MQQHWRRFNQTTPLKDRLAAFAKRCFSGAISLLISLCVPIFALIIVIEDR
jgi:hypothetical protein